MLRHPQHNSLREAIALGLAAACFFALSGCDSSTAPSSSGGHALPSHSFTQDAPEDGVVVIGTGNPAVDVPAVQAAVDQGGEVILKGHFSFDAPATKPLAPPLSSPGAFLPPAAEVLIANGVSISGGRDEGGETATIDGGTIPFYINNAGGQQVTIRELGFVRPTAGAILVQAANGLEIASIHIAGVIPFAHQSSGIGVFTVGGIPNPTTPGNPELISGTLRFERNDIDMTGGTSADNTLGITVFSAGAAGAEVDTRVTENRISNVTEPAINFRRIVGRVDIEHNVITTGTVRGTAPRNQVIRIANIGSYRIAHNSITCEWATSDAEGIGAFSQFAAWPLENAVIADNDVNMSAPAGTVFSTFSAGVGVYGFANNNVVRHNAIHGAALAGLSIPSVFPLPPQAPASPQNNAFIRNRFVDFAPADSDVFVGNHALGTRVVGQGSVDDQGTGTIVIAAKHE